MLTLAVYKATEQFPKPEMYALTNQVQRAAVSIPANIAEGCGKDSDGELKRYFAIAMGSASELEYFLLLARDLGIFTGKFTSPFKTIWSKLAKCSMHSSKS